LKPLLLLLTGLVLHSIVPAAGWAQSNPFTSPAPAPADAPAASPAESASETVRELSSPAGTGLVTRWQRFLHSRLSDSMMQLRGRTSPAKVMISMLVAFAYGFIHAMGPGHRKTVLAGLFASRKYRRIDALYAGIGFGILHGGSAIVIVFLLYAISTGPLSLGMERTGALLERGSWFALLLIGCWILFSAAYELFSHTSHKDEAKPQQKNRHLAVAAVIGSGVVPCPGAALVLSFSLVYQVVAYGILAVAAMSLGMGTALTLVALTAGGAGFLIRRLGTLAKRMELISHLLELAGGIIISLFALLMII
jgi:nickel/cobalt transporter (NicO) family protein